MEIKRNKFEVGDPAPWFRIASSKNPAFNFSMLAGRNVALCFVESLALPESQAIVHEFSMRRRVFDNTNASAVIVSVDPEDPGLQRHIRYAKHVVFLWDLDRQMSEKFGIIDSTSNAYRRQTIVLDRRLRMLASLPIQSERHATIVAQFMRKLPLPTSVRGHAPVLIIPRVFEPDLCRTLIQYYRDSGSQYSGVMQQIGDQTVPVIDPMYKSRRDCKIMDERLCAILKDRLYRRVVPEVERSFQFRCTHLERYIVACYDAAEGGKFNAHRDNTTTGTAHRKFAVTINLNAEEYEGGDLVFREFGTKAYRAPTGGAVVFSCSLMHEALPILKGQRFAFLPFLFDRASAEQQDESRENVSQVAERRSVDDRPDRLPD